MMRSLSYNPERFSCNEEIIIITTTTKPERKLPTDENISHHQSENVQELGVLITTCLFLCQRF